MMWRPTTSSMTGILATSLDRCGLQTGEACHEALADEYRLVPNAMEPRAALGDYDTGTDSFTLYTTSQNPHVAR